MAKFSRHARGRRLAARERHVQRGAESDFLGRLATRVGLPVGTTIVVGERIVEDGVTLIPIARARWGFGGGAGDEGEGGGGGASVSPVGLVELRNGRVRFHRTLGPVATVAVIVAGTGGAALILEALRRLVADVRRRPEAPAEAPADSQPEAAGEMPTEGRAAP